MVALQNQGPGQGKILINTLGQENLRRENWLLVLGLNPNKGEGRDRRALPMTLS
jgi:hypothetical protein